MKPSTLFAITLGLFSCLVTYVSSANTGASCSTGTPNGIRVYPGSQAISNALAYLPSNGKTYTLLLAAGTYTEKVIIRRKNVILRSCASTNEVIVQYNAGVSTSGNNNDASTSVLTVKASNFAAYGIVFRNIHPQARNTAALALTVDSARHVAFYGCTFFGFQDTVLINRGAIAYFKSCWIEGSVDFIWGYGTAFFDGCTIASNSPSTITAHNRVNSTAAGAFVFNSCNVIPVVASIPSLANRSIGFTSVQQADNIKGVYLGRPYNQYARVVYMFSILGAHINAAGWRVWSNLDPRTSGALFGTYNNTGEGASCTGASFATHLNSTTVQPFGLNALFGGDVSWIDKSANNIGSVY